MVCGRVACCFAYAARWRQKWQVSSVHRRSSGVSPSVVSPGGASAKVEWTPSTWPGKRPPSTVVMLPPQSPPWARNRSWPSRPMSSTQAAAIRSVPHPVVAGLSL